MDQNQLQDPFSELWARLCDARRKAYKRVRGNEGVDDLFLGIVYEERKVFDAFMRELPRD